MDGPVTQPGDDNWFIPETEEICIDAAAAVGPDAFVFAAGMGGEFTTLGDSSRFYRYDAGRWIGGEVGTYIEDLLVLKPPQERGENLLVLASEGKVWFVGDDTRMERVRGEQTDPRLGPLTRLRLTAGSLYAFGMSSQCYRRQDGSWVADDEGMRGFEPPFPRKRPIDIGKVADLKDLVTAGNGDEYVCGDVFSARPALYWRPGGSGRWRWLGYAVDDQAYDQLIPKWFLLQPPDTVWITTNKGVLVRGNAATGFRIATEVARTAPRDGSAPRPANFYHAVFYDGAIHVGSNMGPLRLRADGGWDVLTPQGVLTPGSGPFAAGRLRVSGHVIWVFGIREVARYDGQRWEAVPMPSVYRSKP